VVPVINKKETGVNLRKHMDRCGITPKDVQQYLGLGCVQSVYRWLAGVNVPTIDNLYALSELFQVPIDEMIRGNRRELQRKPMRPKDERLHMYYKRIRAYQAA
jgi:transcriptional regulator with XRE-family HTH domain